MMVFARALVEFRNVPRVAVGFPDLPDVVFHDVVVALRHAKKLGKMCLASNVTCFDIET